MADRSDGMADIDVDAYRSNARAWLERNLPRAGTQAKRERGEVPTAEHLTAQRSLQRTLFDAGYAGIDWPVEYGGQGLTAAHRRAFEEEAAHYELPNLAPLHNTTYRVCGPTILAHAAADFKALHLPRILAGEELWAQFFSEPEAGSDLAGVRTRADPDGSDGSGWILNGAKVWTSGAQYADYGMCLARTNWDVPKHRGLTWFAVPTDAPGLTIRPIREINGGAEFCEEWLESVALPDSARIGAVNDGWSVCITMLGYERTAGKVSSGTDSRPGPLPPQMVRSARARHLLADSATRQRIAEAHSNNYVVAQLARAMTAAEPGGTALDPAYLKLATGTFNPVNARLALDVGGTPAIAWAPAEPAAGATSTDYLNARLRSIAGGTNEMQRNGIAERVLGLPREDRPDASLPFATALANAGRWGRQQRREDTATTPADG